MNAGPSKVFVGSLFLVGMVAVGAAGCSSSSSPGGSTGHTRTPPGSAPSGCQDDPSLGCSSDALGITCPSGTSPDSSTLVCMTCSTATVDPSTGDSLYCCVDSYTGSSSGTGSSGGTTSGCSPDPSLTCDAGSDPYDCAAGDNPETYDASLRCSDPSPQSDGTDGFCCATGFSGSTCAQDPTVSGCGYPSVGFSCTGSDTPDQADATLVCSSAPIDPTTGDSLYCCQ
jgi:hypothetical protein